MRKGVWLVLIPAVVLLAAALIIRPTGADYRQKVVDVSWPNCKSKTADVFAAGIVGVTGGLNFHANPCAGEEAGWFSHYAIYMNTGFPGGRRGQMFTSSPRKCSIKNSSCLAYNYGYHAALYAIAQANLQNVHADQWWLDVETENSWSDNFLVNRQFVKGAAAAIKHKLWFAQVGVYSSRTQWNEIMGPWKNKLSVWWATGSKNKDDAAKWCREKSFTGGKVWLAQYTIKYDENYPCSPRFINHVSNEPPRSLPKLKF